MSRSDISETGVQREGSRNEAAHSLYNSLQHYEEKIMNSEGEYGHRSEDDRNQLEKQMIFKRSTAPCPHNMRISELYIFVNTDTGGR